MNIARQVGGRVRDKHGELDAVFGRAAGVLGTLVRGAGDGNASRALMDALGQNPRRWRAWLPVVLRDSPPGLAATTLRSMAGLHMPEQLTLVRQLADVAAGTWTS